MKSENKSVLAAVAKFVYNGFKNGAMGSTWLLCSALTAAINISTDYLQITILSI